ncbi:MAG: peptidylprolyl isomerase [Myxococcota bacterium]
MKLRFSLMGIALIASLAACEKEIPRSELAARVNGTPILKKDFEEAVARNLLRYESAGHQLEDRVKERIKESVLRRLVEFKVMQLEAKKLKIEVTPGDVEERFQEHKSRWRTDEQFKEYLTRSQNTVENMKRDLERNMLRDRVVKNLAGEVSITEDDVKKYYEEHPERFVNKERVRVSRIYKRVTPTMSDTEKQKVRSDITAIAQKAKKPDANFGDLARENSDSGDAKKGGELGWVVRGRMPAEFEQVAFTLEPGTVSDVVQTRSGFEVIKVWERQPEKRRALEEVGKTIRTSLEARERNKRRRDVLKQLQEGAKVETFLEFDTGRKADGGGKMPQPPAAGGASPIKAQPAAKAEDK